MGSIYVLVDPESQEIRYVGWTSKPLSERLRQHLREKQRCHRMWWIRGLLRRGCKPSVRLVQTVSNDHWQEAERYWIRYFKSLGCPLTNGTDGGEGVLGHKVSEATKAKLRAATKRQFQDPAARQAVSQRHKGKDISKGHRRIVSQATQQRWAEWRASGATASEETREKIRTARLGSVTSEETKAKLQAALKGRVKTPEHQAKITASLRLRASLKAES